MALCALWCAVVLTCVLCCYGDDAVPPSPPWETPSPVERPHECDMYIRKPNSGNNTSFTVSQYLSSKGGVGCTNAISSKLKKIFSEGEESAKIRADLERTKLGSVCSAFVNIMSVIVFNNKEMRGGICSDNLFDDSSVDTDFCEKMKGIEPVTKTGLETDIQSFDFNWASSAAEGVTTLQDLEAADCTEKCGEGYSKVLCNAYYSIAVLFGQEFPIVLKGRNEGQKEIPPDPSPSPPEPSPANTSPAGSSSSDPLSRQEPSKSVSDAIQKLLFPLLSLDKEGFTALLDLGTPSIRKNMARRLLTLSSKQNKTLDSVEDFKQLLQMVYVVKVAGDKLRDLSDMAFERLAMTSDDLTLFVTRATFDDLKKMLGEDFGAVMSNVRTYKDELFAKPTQSPGSSGESSAKSPSTSPPWIQGHSHDSNSEEDSQDNQPAEGQSQGSHSEEDAQDNQPPEGQSQGSHSEEDAQDNQPPEGQSQGSEEDAQDNQPPKGQSQGSEEDAQDNQPPKGQSQGSHSEEDSQDNQPAEGQSQRGPSEDGNLSSDNELLEPETTPLPGGFPTGIDLNGDWTEDDDDDGDDGDGDPWSNMDNDIPPPNPDQSEVDRYLEILTPLKNNKTFLALLQEVDSGSTETGMANEARDKLIASLMKSLKLEKDALIEKLKDPKLREKLGVEVMVSSTNEEGEDSPSRFGAFHFLGLFLLVGGAVVVGYLCLHNRKKIREGVGNYMTSDSKRRRARKYKPLATSEA